MSRCSRPGCCWRERSTLPTCGRQLARWTRSGKIRQLRRGLYSPWRRPWEKRIPHPFLVANRLVRGSYVSGLSALAFVGAIPEYVAEVTSVTPGRPHMRKTPFGRFSFRHLKPGLLFGYRRVDLGDGARAFVAEPEKALLDLVHLHPGGDDAAYLRELRLDFDALRLDRLESFAAAGATPKLARAAERVRRIAGETARSPSVIWKTLEYETQASSAGRLFRTRRQVTGRCEGLPAATWCADAGRCGGRNVRARIPAGAHSRSVAARRCDDLAGVSRRNLPAFSVQPAALFRGPRLRPGGRPRGIPAGTLGCKRSAPSWRRSHYRIDLRIRDSRTVHSAMVRFPGLLYEIGLSPHAAEVLAIKIEVDNPAAGRSDHGHQPGAPARDATAVSP